MISFRLAIEIHKAFFVDENDNIFSTEHGPKGDEINLAFSR